MAVDIALFSLTLPQDVEGWESGKCNPKGEGRWWQCSIGKQPKSFMPGFYCWVWSFHFKSVPDSIFPLLVWSSQGLPGRPHQPQPWLQEGPEALTLQGTVLWSISNGYSRQKWWWQRYGCTFYLDFPPLIPLFIWEAGLQRSSSQEV